MKKTREKKFRTNNKEKKSNFCIIQGNEKSGYVKRERSLTYDSSNYHRQSDCL